MVSPDDASEIACPIVAQAVTFVLQSLPSSPLTPLTYHVPASAGEDSMIRAPKTGTTLPFHILTFPPSRTGVRQPSTVLIINRSALNVSSIVRTRDRVPVLNFRSERNRWMRLRRCRAAANVVTSRSAFAVTPPAFPLASGRKKLDEIIEDAVWRLLHEVVAGRKRLRIDEIARELATP